MAALLVLLLLLLLVGVLIMAKDLKTSATIVEIDTVEVQSS